MKNDKTRTRLLRVLEILKVKSDAEHPISSSEMLEELAKYGIEAERKSIYKDIEALQEAGYLIGKSAGKKRGFYMDGRGFTLPELSLLTDAVMAAGFVPKRNTQELVGKLQAEVSVYQAAELKDRVFIENRSKAKNSEIYDNIEILNTAIIKSRKVKLIYEKAVLNGTNLVANQKEMVISPYALLWESDHYYLIGNNQKYDNLTHLRVDRIAKVEMLKSESRHFSEVSEYQQRFDTADYAKKVFNMFGGEKCRIDLECNVKLLDQMTDKFTDGIFIRHFDGEDTFRFTADAVLSEGLIGWLMQFGGDVKVLSPESLKQGVLQKAEMLLKIYS